jgi:hypothetical protein
MAKYKLKALSVFIDGKCFLKEQNTIFDTKVFPKGSLDGAIKGGFLEEISDESILEEIETEIAKNDQIELEEGDVVSETVEEVDVDDVVEEVVVKDDLVLNAQNIVGKKK